MILVWISASQCRRYLCTNSTQMHPTPPTSPTVRPQQNKILVLCTTVQDQHFL